MKNPLTAGIEPSAFRFVSRHLNHCATAVSAKSGGGHLSLMLNFCVFDYFWSILFYVTVLLLSFLLYLVECLDARGGVVV